MTEEELREKIVNMLHLDYNWAIDERLNDKEIDKYFKSIADHILTLIRKAGWKSPDEIIGCPNCEHDFKVGDGMAPLLRNVKKIKGEP